jgi:hypothetical protein
MRPFGSTFRPIRYNLPAAPERIEARTGAAWGSEFGVLSSEFSEFCLLPLTAEGERLEK